MIIIDTNIISELMKSLPAPQVIAWIDQQDIMQLFITTVTIAEITYGLHALPPGNRRVRLEDAFNRTIVDAFEHRLLTFDESAAHSYGQVMARRKKMGLPLSILDGQIAGIAHSHNSALATRNIRDFAKCGLDLVNPFESD